MVREPRFPARAVGWASVGLVAALVAAVSACEAEPPLPHTGTLTRSINAYCAANVIGVGWVDTENDYLPHVIQCENGGAPLEALKAQAVAARTYLYYKMDTAGAIADGTSDQVFSCGATPGPQHYQAVHETAGEVLRYGGVTICAFYVAGAIPSASSCVAASWDPDPTNTEHYVTYNWGRSGSGIRQTTLGWVNPGNYYNRGCKSQNGARCLALHGWGHRDILRFYYGMDIGFEVAVGWCVSECTPGDVQNRPCPECGWQSRACDGAGHWTGWSPCSGESARACSISNEWGTCDGRQDCAPSGYWSPCSAPAPAEELCDALDNDCNGEVDDGDPVQMGATVPAYAARLVDHSYPLSLGPGEAAEVWGDFENVGTATWTRRQVWLGSLEAAEGRTSRLYDAEGWAAWDAAAVLEQDVPPGEVARFIFTIRAPAEPGERVEEMFRLFDPAGEPIRCPGPGIEIGLKVLGAGSAPDDPVSPEDGTGVGYDDQGGGCGCSVGPAGGRRAERTGERRADPAILLLLLAVGFCMMRRRVL